MKILLYSNGYSEKFIGLSNTINKTKHEIGSVVGQLNETDLETFAPNLVLYYSKQPIPLFDSKKFVSINLDIKEPFIDTVLIENKKHKKYYESDITYIGDPKAFGDSLVKFFSLDYRVKIFNPQPLNLFCYSGMIPRDQFSSAYYSAKVCPVHHLETDKLFEIICSDGNPVVFNKNTDHLDYTLMINSALDGEKFDTGFTKEQILSNHTNHDVMSKILTAKGLAKLGKEVLELKSKQ